MKKRFAHQSLWALAFAAIPLLNGCTQQSAGPAPAYVTTSTPAPTVVTVPPEPVQQLLPVGDPTPVMTIAAAPALIISNAPALPTETAVPANLRLSKPLSEIIRLVQSGVDEPVILTYVTNSPAIFTLGAEEIVYLNDLGISSSVITAMMQRDQALRSAWADAPTPAASSATIAAAPTYVNPPQALPTPEPQPAPVYVSNNYFQETLSPYGSWVEVDGYGRCWRPTVSITSSSWQPYRDRGRWVYTDAGWYWMSDYSWGSVAFHYGRWFNNPRYGWCWWPDTVWSPSWVTWRYDNDNCGWAPLPPRSYYRPGAGFYYRDRAVGLNFDFELSVGAFTFIPWGRFCDARPYQHYLPRPRSVAIYNQTTVINNVVVGNNNTIINRGIDKDRVRERSRTEVRTVNIRDENVRTTGPRVERFERDGRTLVVNRPTLPTPNSAVLSGQPGERTTERNVGTLPADRRGTEPRIQPGGNRPGLNDRDGRDETRRPRETETRPVVRTAPQNNIAPTPNTPPAVTPPSRTETRPDREMRKQNDATPRSRPNSTTVIRLPETTPTPVRTPTPIFFRPVVVQTPAYTPTREISGGLPPENTGTGSNPSGRPNRRENSTWTTPAPQPQPTPRNQNNLAIDNAPQIQNRQPTPVAPTYSRPSLEPRRDERTGRNDSGERNSRSRSEERNSSATYSAPAARPVAPAFTPAPAPTPRPSYTPPPAPAPRVETPSAPARSEPRATESRPDSNRGGRNP